MVIKADRNDSGMVQELNRSIHLDKCEYKSQAHACWFNMKANLATKSKLIIKTVEINRDN